MQPQMSQKLWNPPNLMDQLPNEWAYGLFDCFSDIENCIYVILCGPCAIGKIADQLDGNGCCCPLFISQSLCYRVDLRRRVRQRYNIQSGENTDCCSEFWCGPCSTCQQLNQTKL